MRPEIIEETVTKWTEDPAAAQSVAKVTARVEEGQALIQAGAFTWRADLPPSLGGAGQAPSPTALLLSALAGCAVVFVHDTIAPQLGLRIESVEATVQCEADARGLLGMNQVAPDLRNLAVDVKVVSPDGEAAVAEIAQVWRERCPIYLALVKPTGVEVRFTAG